MIRTDFTMPPRMLRRGFTLVELMIVIVIIAILSALFLGALDQAEQTAKASRTTTLVQKLHNMLMARWDAYRTVRLPINVDARGPGNQANAGNEGQSRFRQDVARTRMLAIRELIRMEMPDRYDDLMFEPALLRSPMGNTPIRPFLWSAYQRRILAAKAVNASLSKMLLKDFVAQIAINNQDAECLYLVMTVGVEDTSTSVEHFSASDVGDTDQDGMPEFIDAWGSPVRFLRWAPGFVSPAQPIYNYKETDPKASIFHNSQPRDPRKPDEFQSRWKIQIDRVTDTNTSPAKVVEKLVIIDQDDPFNPMRVGPTPDNIPNSGWTKSSRWRPGDPGPEHGYILMPLIYSMGRDTESGIEHAFKEFGWQIASSPTQSTPPATIYESDPYNLYRNPETSVNQFRGAERGDGRNFDNIHNQQISTR